MPLSIIKHHRHVHAIILMHHLSSLLSKVEWEKLNDLSPNEDCFLETEEIQEIHLGLGICDDG